MVRSRVLALGLFALLALEAAPVRADMAPWPFRTKRPDPAPQPPQRIDLETGEPVSPRPPEPPKRAGVFRTCGSGAGLGLAAIGATWGLLWLGTRFAGRGRGTKGGRAG